MKKLWLLALVFSLILSGCALPFIPQPAPAVTEPTPDLAGTAAVLSQETLQAQPTPTLVPSNTPVISLPSETPQALATATTDNSALLTTTGTLGIGTPGTTVVTVTQKLTATATGTQSPGVGATPTETLHPRFFGTLPPNLPFGKAKLINKSKAEAYISLQCTTSDGFVTIIEYPVRGTMEVKIPKGSYVYVAWVGGNKMVGNFKFGGDQITIKLLKDSVQISQ